MTAPRRDTAALIADLAAAAGPVRRLAPPGRRAGLYLAAGVALVVLLALLRGLRGDLPEQIRRAEFLVPLAGALLTTAGAAFAALELAIPGRSRAWALAALPGAVLWLGGIGQSCLTAWFPLGPGLVSAAEVASCLLTVVLSGTPLTLGMFLLLRRARPLNATPSLLLGGVAAAALTAVALGLLHSINASLMILLWTAALLAVMTAAQLAARRAVSPAV